MGNILTAAAPWRRTQLTVWTVVEPGSYVARRGGRKLGSVVETGSGNFVALDVAVEAIGRYQTLSAAKQSVDDQYRWQAKGDVHRRFRRRLVIASVVGLLAVTLLPAAVWFAVSLWAGG